MKFTNKELHTLFEKAGKTSRTIFYDGGCALCNKSVRFIKKYDTKKAFTYIPLHFSEQGNEKGEILNSVIYLDHEKIYTESDAVLQIVHHLKGSVSWLYFLKIIPRFLRDKVYRVISTNRYKWFGRNEVC